MIIRKFRMMMKDCAKKVIFLNKDKQVNPQVKKDLKKKWVNKYLLLKRLVNSFDHNKILHCKA